MEDVYEELDEAKAEVERLKTEVRVKTELSDALKKVHNEQLIKFQEAKWENEKQAQELNVKLEEISQSRQASETLQSLLLEKESSLRHLTSLHEKLRADGEKKLQKLEGENRDLVSALNEATEKNTELEQNFGASTKEIEGLKRLLSTKERKCFEAEQKALEAKELRQRDDVIIGLEEENRNAQDQLKWKKEQFTHLEEAHRRLRAEFQLGKEEWEREKSALLEEISLLQINLDSQTRILKGVQKRLEMCNHALAHEESKRKFLEVEVSEFRSRYENAFAQCEEERSKFDSLTVQGDEEIAKLSDSLTVQGDEEIAKLRNSLSTKESLSKETEFRIVHLERENRELRESIKELQEAQIKNCAPAALTKLRNKLRGMEQTHSNCSTNLKAKESEVSLLIEKMKGDVNRHNFELKDREEQIQKLQMELKSCHSVINVLNVEISVLLTIFKSELSEAYSNKSDEKTEMELCNIMDDKISLLQTELEMKNSDLRNAHLKLEQLQTELEMKNRDLRNAHLKLEQEHVKAEMLMNRVRSLELAEQQQVIMEEEVQRLKKMLEESSVHQLYMKEQFVQMKMEKREVSLALEKANLELAEEVCEASQLEFELQNWKSRAERLKVCCQENQEKCRQMEDSLLAQVEYEETLKHEKDSHITIIKEEIKKREVLQQKIALLEATVAAKNEEVEFIPENLMKNAKEKDSCIENLQNDIMRMEQEAMTREVKAAIFASIDAEKTVGLEKDKLFKVINEKDEEIKNLQVLALSLEQDLTSAFISSFSEVVENLVTIEKLTEALKKAKHMTELEIEEKNMRLVELEKEVSGLRKSLKNQEEALFTEKRQADGLQALLEANKLENDKLMGEQRRLEGISKQLEFEKLVLLQDTTSLSKDREHVLVHFEEFCDRMGDFTCEDVEMMNLLDTILQKCKEEVKPAMNLKVDNELHDSTQENENNSISPSARKLEACITGRSPLKEMNQQEFVTKRRNTNFH